MTKRKGISLTEMIISALVLAVVMLGATGFAVNFIDTSFTHSRQIQNVNEIRNIVESITNEISKAEYIYPAGTQIALHSTSGSSRTINTSNSVALLFEEDGDYGFIAYYIVEDQLFQFVAAPFYDWTESTSPAMDLTSVSGSSSRIITDISTENTTLRYVLNYDDGITDEILEGQISGIADDNVNALIKGIEWDISQENVENQTIKIKELSKNVPRFIE